MGFGKSKKGVEKVKNNKLKTLIKEYLPMLLLSIIMTFLFGIVIIQTNKKATKCDQSKGYTCSIYEINHELYKRD